MGGGSGVSPSPSLVAFPSPAPPACGRGVRQDAAAISGKSQTPPSTDISQYTATPCSPSRKREGGRVRSLT